MQLTVANIVALIVKLKVRRMLIKKKNESERETVTEIQIAVTETVEVTDTNTLFLAIFGSVIFLKLFLFNLFLFLQRSGGAEALPAPPSAWSLLSRSSLSSLSFMRVAWKIC